MFAGVGERTREGNDLYREMIESVSRGRMEGFEEQSLRTSRQAAKASCRLLSVPGEGEHGSSSCMLSFLTHAQGVIKLGDKRGESKCTLVYGQMNEPPGARARVALTGEQQLRRRRREREAGATSMAGGGRRLEETPSWRERSWTWMEQSGEEQAAMDRLMGVRREKHQSSSQCQAPRAITDAALAVELLYPHFHRVQQLGCMET